MRTTRALFCLLLRKFERPRLRCNKCLYLGAAFWLTLAWFLPFKAILPHALYSFHVGFTLETPDYKAGWMNFANWTLSGRLKVSSKYPSAGRCSLECLLFLPYLQASWPVNVTGRGVLGGSGDRLGRRHLKHRQRFLLTTISHCKRTTLGRSCHIKFWTVNLANNQLGFSCKPK